MNMAVTCEMLLKTAYLNKKMSLVGGENGLNRIVQWFHAIESTEELRFLRSHELVFMTGISIGNDSAKLLQMVRGVNEKKVAGLVINTGKYIEQIPPDVIQYADEKKIPLFNVRWAVKLGDITRYIGELIMMEKSREQSAELLVKKILFAEIKDYHNLLTEDVKKKYGLDQVCCVMVLDLLETNGTGQEELSEERRLDVQKIIGLPFARLLIWYNGNAVMLLPQTEISLADGLGVYAEKLRESLQKRFEAEVYIGIGNVYKEMADFKKSYKEACFALRLARKQKGVRCLLYADTNVFRLFDRIGDVVFLREYYQELMGPLLAYDKKNKARLTETLEVYLDENENAATTIARLFIHRNTLTYRLRRIEEIMNCDIMDSDHRLNFRLAFKMKRFLEFMQD